ncbi:MAG: hypothetical protein KDA57_14450 [Planctomycetales bacterium]|nr:hypothetical protein [Planctomycetales bacterium]
MNANLTRVALAGLVLAALVLMTADCTRAQCTTCPTPTVAYQPVAVQPVVATTYNGWYPGKMLDRMRLRRYGYATVAPSYPTAAYAAPTYTASYAPYTSYSAGYTPYVTGYAPLATTVARPVVQTSYYVPTSYYAPSSCSSCAQTVARQVVLSPVVSDCCSTCGVASCGGCSACSTCSAVSQASYTEPACSSCASTAAVPSYSSPSPSNGYPGGGGTVGTPTPQPQLEPAPTQSNYPSTDPANGSQNGEKSIVEPAAPIDPAPIDESDANDASTYFEAPRLLDPHDRTAQRQNSNGPTVDVWNAVYRGQATSGASQTSHKKALTQAEIDAEGWHAVPRNR